MYKQYDIVLVPFPYSDLSGNKQRPALIISNNNLNKSEDRICVLITSVPNLDSIKIEDKDIILKLPFESYVKPYRIFTVSNTKIIKKITSVKKEFHNKVIQKINFYIENNYS